MRVIEPSMGAFAENGARQASFSYTIILDACSYYSTIFHFFTFHYSLFTLPPACTVLDAPPLRLAQLSFTTQLPFFISQPCFFTSPRPSSTSQRCFFTSPCPPFISQPCFFTFTRCFSISPPPFFTFQRPRVSFPPPRVSSPRPHVSHPPPRVTSSLPFFHKYLSPPPHHPS